MTEQITIETAKQILQELKHTMGENKEMLIKLDSVMGDGDLGLTMEKIFAASYEQMKDSSETSLGKFFILAGMAMAKAAPSTMGTLVAGAFMKGGKNLGDKTLWNAGDLTAFYAGLCQGIMERGKAQTGEKTIVDVLLPVADALQKKQPSSIMEVVSLAETVSKEALEKTKDMVAQHGRAAYYQDASKGHQDAGATVGMLIFEAFFRVLSK